MKIVSKHITVSEEVLTITNQRCLYWPKKNCLILSDLHVGKTAHFRRSGIPIPSEVLQTDLRRLSLLIEHFKPTDILIVGDLFHAGSNNDLILFKQWFQKYQHLVWALVRGNHDKIPFKTLTDLGFAVKKELKISPFLFIHETPKINTEEFAISGHLHPGVLIKGRGKQRLKLPCYVLTGEHLILPAFSLFTGLNTSVSNSKGVYYAFSESELYEFTK